jgi:hypothetical protein
MRCRVAGVRFQRIDVDSLRCTQRVTVQRDTYLDQICYKILDVEGRTLGFVPRPMLPLLGGRKVRSAWLSKVESHALPWKQLEVTLLL